MVSRVGVAPAAPAAGIVAGMERAVGRGVQVCPRAAIAAVLGPRNIEGGDVDARTIDVEVGVDAGRAFDVRSRVQLVPFVGAAVRRSSLELRHDAGESITRSDVYGTIEAGGGIVLARRLAIVPRVSRTLGASNDDASISLAVALGI